MNRLTIIMLYVIIVMFKALKIINSKNKRGMKFVAAGAYQAEFFENEGKGSFIIYRFNYGGEGGAHIF